MNNILDKKTFSLAFSGHETFPLRQMWLKKVVDMGDDNFMIEKAKFADPEFIAELGVGKNMLASMKHWAQACQIIEESSSSYFKLTSLGRNIFLSNGFDPYSEHPTTTWLLHWVLASKGLRATTCFWIFNRINTGSFSKTELYVQIRNLCSEYGKTMSESSLTRDIDTIIRGYAPRVETLALEDCTDPVFGELGLINHMKGGSYSFNRGPKNSLNLAAFVYSVLDFWMPNKGLYSTLSLDAIAYGEASPGRVFKLDEDSIISYLMQVDDVTNGRIRWSDSAGIKQLSKQDFDFDVLMNEMLRKAYEQY